MQDLTAKLCLGTVQFGMKYGVKNELGRQPTDEEAFSVLDLALAVGITTFDTARAYGTAEELLGRFGLAEKGAHIVSKLHPDTADCEEAVLSELHESLQSLRAKKIFCYMLHRAGDLQKSGIMVGLNKAKALGLTETIGVSIYEPEEAMEAALHPLVDVIQIPYNVLDQRLEACEFFLQAAKNGKRVYARSAFLQGLLLMSPQEAEASVSGSGVFVSKFQDIARKEGYMNTEAAMLYVLSHPQIDGVIFGVDTVEQLRENVKILKRGEEFSSCRKQFRRSFENVPREVVVPSLW